MAPFHSSQPQALLKKQTSGSPIPRPIAPYQSSMQWPLLWEGKLRLREQVCGRIRLELRSVGPLACVPRSLLSWSSPLYSSAPFCVCIKVYCICPSGVFGWDPPHLTLVPWTLAKLLFITQCCLAQHSLGTRNGGICPRVSVLNSFVWHLTGRIWTCSISPFLPASVRPHHSDTHLM